MSMGSALWLIRCSATMSARKSSSVRYCTSSIRMAAGWSAESRKAAFLWGLDYGGQVPRGLGEFSDPGQE